MKALSRILAALAAMAGLASADDGLRTFDGKHSIARIEVTAVYFVPKDREPLPDWKDRADYFARRVEAFHARELDGQSTLKVRVLPEPFRSKKTAEEVRGKNPNQTFDHTLTETRETLKWPGDDRQAFPILLVLSEINWRELDDFRRVRVVDGEEEHEGNVDGEGRHFPGAESGGARATYWDSEGLGLGLVSADGWRVPYSGSDCVVYHEGVGHPIGLTHPEPIDASVMGVAQYQGWINQTFLNEDQKKKLGWSVSKDDLAKTISLFTAFTATTSPVVPKVGERVALELRWPPGARLQSLKVRFQTDLAGPWREVPQVVAPEARPPDRLSLPTFEKATPVSYRVDASLADGQSVELWGYFQVK